METVFLTAQTENRRPEISGLYSVLYDCEAFDFILIIDVIENFTRVISAQPVTAFQKVSNRCASLLTPA